MIKFIYEAKNRDGILQKGEIEARNRESALETLINNGLTVVTLKLAKDAPVFSRQLTFLERITLKDMAIVMRQLSVMVEAKVPLVQALKTLASQIKKSSFRKILDTVSNDVENGTLLSDALGKHAKIFSELYAAMVRAGEASGRLQESLIYLADHSEKEYDLRSKVKGAMTYPIFVLIVFVLVASGMLVFVFPKLTEMIVESGAEIPLMTRIIIAASDGLKSGWWLISLIIILGIFVFKKWKNSKSGRLIWDAFKLKFPVFGKLGQRIAITRFSENLGSLIVGGIPVLKALEISGQVVGNKVYENIIISAMEKVKSGQGIAVALEGQKPIPSMVTDMISVGEQSGKLDSVLENIAKFYRREVDSI